MKIKGTSLTLLLGVLSLALVLLKCDAVQCGWQAGGRLCPTQICCSQFGWCGTTQAHCGKGCQSNCTLPAPPAPTPPAPSSPIKDIFPEEMFEEFLKNRNNDACPAKGFYSYYAFITAANYFPEFANTGDLETRKRELAAFFGQTSHETTGGSGWDAPGGSNTWGYCFVEEVGAHGIAGLYCEPSNEWPCVEGKSYYGRGPIQLSYNFNYGPAGVALGHNLLSEPDLVHSDAVISFQAALWFWMTPQSPKPSCHDVITGQWTPTRRDIEGNRFPGYGVITNIINGGLECDIPPPDGRQESRIAFYKRYCDLFGISYGDNLECYHQRPFNWGSFLKGLSST